MDRTGQNAGSQLPARSPSAIVVRSDSLMADAWEGGPDALPQIVRQVQESGRPQGIPPERFLKSCMPLEFMRLYEGRNDKEELLVIGFD